MEMFTNAVHLTYSKEKGYRQSMSRYSLKITASISDLGTKPPFEETNQPVDHV
jgi:hypothetical protein